MIKVKGYLIGEFFLIKYKWYKIYYREDLAKATFNDPNIRTIIEKNTRILKVLNTKDE
jgi:hypothetical protein